MWLLPVLQVLRGSFLRLLPVLAALLGALYCEYLPVLAILQPQVLIILRALAVPNTLIYSQKIYASLRRALRAFLQCRKFHSHVSAESIHKTDKRQCVYDDSASAFTVDADASETGDNWTIPLHCRCYPRGWLSSARSFCQQHSPYLPPPLSPRFQERGSWKSCFRWGNTASSESIERPGLLEFAVLRGSVLNCYCLYSQVVRCSIPRMLPEDLAVWAHSMGAYLLSALILTVFRP